MQNLAQKNHFCKIPTNATLSRLSDTFGKFSTKIPKVSKTQERVRFVGNFAPKFEAGFYTGLKCAFGGTMKHAMGLIAYAPLGDRP